MDSAEQNTVQAPNLGSDLDRYDGLDCPDLVTASPTYRARFSGVVGEYLLQVQAETVLSLAQRPKSGPWKVLDVGGGHAQLAEPFLAAGAEVWVQGSAESCALYLTPLLAKYPERLHFIQSSILQLPFPDKFFNSVVSVRLLSHAPKYSQLLVEMLRVSSSEVIFDFAPAGGFNALYPLLFGLKKHLEGEATRTFLRFSTDTLTKVIEPQGFKVTAIARQFFFPMVLHRKLRSPVVSRGLETAARVLGLTKLLGSPAVLRAERR